MSSADAQVTAAPNFQAFYVHPDGTTEALTCPKGTFTTSGTYAACCSKSECAMATACHDNKLSLDNFNVGSCGQSATCQTMSILSAPGAKGDITSSIFCAPVWLAYEVYRDTVPVITTSTSSTLLTGSTLSSNSADATSNASTRSASAASQTESTSSSDNSSNNHRKAWIAGAVVGPLVFVSLLGLGIWLFLRKRGGSKKREKIPTGEVQEIGGHERPADYNDGGGGGGDWQNRQSYPVSHEKSDSVPTGQYASVSQNQFNELPSDNR